MNNLEVVVKQELGTINFNFEEIKENLATMMSAYEGAIFSDDSIVQAKGECAALRNIDKALNARRIEIKKEFMKPYDSFDAQVKELCQLIQTPITLIDGQVKAFEENQKAKKKQRIETLYSEIIGDVADYLPLVKIYDAKWENKTYLTTKIKAELESLVESTVAAIDTIKSMNSECIDKALIQFKADLSLANAITYINKYEQQKAEILARDEQKRKDEEERKRLAEIERAKADERKRVIEEEHIREVERKATEERLMSIAPTPVEVVTEVVSEVSTDGAMPFTSFEIHNVTCTLNIKATEEEIRQVVMYLNSLGLEFERVGG